MSTEIIDISKHELTLGKGGDLNEPRERHGMGVVYLDGFPSLITFGGMRNSQMTLLNTVEVWNDKTETWQSSNMTLKTSRMGFGYATFPTELLCTSDYD